MPRQRFIHPCIWSSEGFIALSHGARLTFIGLFSMADDEGRGKGSPVSLKASLFPADDVSPEQIGKWCDEVVNGGMARFYEVQQVVYYDLPMWADYQKPKYPTPSKYPPFHNDGTLPQRSPSVPPAVGKDSPLGRVGKGWVGKGREGLGEESGSPRETRYEEPIEAPAYGPSYPLPRPPRPREAHRDVLRDGIAALRGKPATLDEAAEQAAEESVKMRLRVEAAVIREHPDWSSEQKREEIARQYEAARTAAKEAP